MKKIYPYLALVILSGLALIPPIDWFIKNPYNDKWLWMIMIAAFLGIMTWMVKCNWYVRIIAVAGFINCFFSVIPYLSFTAYVLLVSCCWFYIVCERIEDWTPIFKALQVIVLLNVFLIFMECFHKDPLLNFDAGNRIDQYGILGHHMLMGSFTVIAAALLINFNRLNIIFPFLIAIVCCSTWSFFCATIGLFVMIHNKATRFAHILYMVIIALVVAFLVWSHFEGKFYANIEHGAGRGFVWAKTLDLSTGRPWLGWGIGSYKDIFPALSIQPQHYIPYRNAHNFILQLCFELGFPLTAFIVLGLGMFLWSLFRYKLYINAAGIIMVILDAQCHFPDRVTQCVPIIIALLAYSAFCLRRAE